MTYPRRSSGGPRDSQSGSESSSRKYQLLHILGRVLVWLGTLLLAVDVMGTLVLLYKDLPSAVASDMVPPATAVLLTSGIGLLGALLSLMVIAAGQAIECFLDIESHMRLVAQGVKNAMQ